MTRKTRQKLERGTVTILTGAMMFVFFSLFWMLVWGLGTTLLINGELKNATPLTYLGLSLVTMLMFGMGTAAYAGLCEVREDS